MVKSCQYPTQVISTDLTENATFILPLMNASMYEQSEMLIEILKC